MNKTKEKVVLQLLAIIALLIGLWVGALVLFLYKTIDYNNLISNAQCLCMPSTNDNVFSGEIIKVETNYTSLEKKTAENVSVESNSNKIYLGKFKITHYCACTKCCGANAKGITASGKKVEANKTIAVDTKIIKLGSKVLIDDYGEMEAQDTGSAIKGNVIDVYVPSHEQALKMGVVYKDVYVIK